MSIGNFNNKLVWLIFVIFFLHSLSVSAQDKITWLYSGFPPVQIESGAYAKKGYIDFVVHLLIDNLVDFEHSELKCNYARSHELLKEQERVAHPALLKRSDRELFTEFSIPSYVLLPNEILVPTRVAHKLKQFIDDDGLFHLEDAITQSDLRLGIASERAYGGIIDKVLEKHQNNPNIHVRYETDLLTQLFKLMEHDRIDYIIGYAAEGQYFEKTKKTNDRIVSIPVKDMPKYYLGYVGLPKNLWGKSVIGKVNAILEKHRNTPEFHAAYEYWLDDEAKKRYRKLVKEIQTDSEST